MNSWWTTSSKTYEENIKKSWACRKCRQRQQKKLWKILSEILQQTSHRVELYEPWLLDTYQAQSLTPKAPQPSSLKTYKCHLCQQEGHYCSQCPQQVSVNTLQAQLVGAPPQRASPPSLCPCCAGTHVQAPWWYKEDTLGIVCAIARSSSTRYPNREPLLWETPEAVLSVYAGHIAGISVFKSLPRRSLRPSMSAAAPYSPSW